MAKNSTKIYYDIVRTIKAEKNFKNYSYVKSLASLLLKKRVQVDTKSINEAIHEYDQIKQRAREIQKKSKDNEINIDFTTALNIAKKEFEKKPKNIFDTTISNIKKQERLLNAKLRRTELAARKLKKELR